MTVRSSQSRAKTIINDSLSTGQAKTNGHTHHGDGAALPTVGSESPEAPMGEQRATAKKANKTQQNPTSRHSKSNDGNGLQNVLGLLGLLGAWRERDIAPFPVHVLPQKLRSFASSIAAAMPCPVDYPSVLMLPILGMFIGRKIGLSIKPGWTEYPLLWCMIVADTGYRKSPVFKLITAPLRHMEEWMRSDYELRKREWDAKDPRDRNGFYRPVRKRFFTTDSTMEALHRVLSGNPNGVAYCSDEMVGWIKGMNQYRGGLGNDRPNWLSIHSGVSIIKDRVGEKEPIEIPNPHVCIIGGTQPDMLPFFIDDAQTDGCSARLLISYPFELEAGDWTDAGVTGEEDFRSVCKALWDLEQSEPLRLAPEAKGLFVEWVNHHRREKPPDNVKEIWPKAEAHCLRIALILFLARKVCKGSKGEAIDQASMIGACDVVEYFKAHAMRVYNHASDGAAEKRIHRAQAWAKRQIAKGRLITPRLVHQSGICGVKTSDDAKSLLESLTNAGLGELTNTAYIPYAEPTQQTQQPNKTTETT